MDYKELLEQIKDFLSACEQMRYGEYVGAPWPYNHDGPMVYTEPDAVLLGLASTAITDLLARAEAAEAAQETLQRAMAEYKVRAEKAERERDAAVQCLAEKCRHIESTEQGDYCIIDDEPCDRCIGVWRGQKEE